MYLKCSLGPSKGERAIPILAPSTFALSAWCPSVHAFWASTLTLAIFASKAQATSQLQVHYLIAATTLVPSDPASYQNFGHLSALGTSLICLRIDPFGSKHLNLKFAFYGNEFSLNGTFMARSLFALVLDPVGAVSRQFTGVLSCILSWSSVPCSSILYLCFAL